MPLNIIVGTQWGDEGKGRMVDLLSASSDMVARFNGGDNAGHTVTVQDRMFKLHLIPSGIIHPHTIGVLGNGMVINPQSLLKEMSVLKETGVDVSPTRLKISYSAHIITPAHIALDKAKEAALGKGQIGTTRRGIGPAYTDKVARSGLRMIDLLDSQLLKEKLRVRLRQVNLQLEKIYQVNALDEADTIDGFLAHAAQLKDYIADTAELVDACLRSNKKVLAEGAQGTLLDIDHGSYPFVTSSNVTASSVFNGLGIGIVPVERVIGVTKVFQSRVGAGDFPTEVSGDMALRLRGSGEKPWDEFGTTTGRPRRVGWLDAVLLRYACRLNGLTDIVLTKLDILSGLPVIPVCTDYSQKTETGSAAGQLRMTGLGNVQPVYANLPGWQEDISSARNWYELPENTRSYVRFIERYCGVRVMMASVGPERSQIVKVPM